MRSTFRKTLHEFRAIGVELRYLLSVTGHCIQDGKANARPPGRYITNFTGGRESCRGRCPFPADSGFANVSTIIDR